jgi:hypothetical protein
MLEALSHGPEYYDRVKKIVDTYQGAKGMYDVYIEH